MYCSSKKPGPATEPKAKPSGLPTTAHNPESNLCWSRLATSSHGPGMTPSGTPSLASPLTTAPALRPASRLQRQPAAPPASAAPATTPSPAAQLYAKALPLVKSLDASVFTVLSKAPLGGGTQEVGRSTVTPENPADPPKTIVIKLEVLLAALPAKIDAQFDARATSMTQTSVPGGGTQYTFNPAILINSTVPAGATEQEMAETLVHEGTHLQIMMDPLLNQRSKHFRKFSRYQEVAEQQGAHFKRKVGFFIDLVYTKNKLNITEAQRLKDAAKVVSLIVEEKYVYDQDALSLGKLRSNQRIASDYVGLGLEGVGIPAAQQPAKELAALVQDATAFLDVLDRWVHNLPALNFPVDPLPPPLPVLVK